jgi:flavin-binding protein dodecin
MAVLKVIEVLTDSDTSWEDATRKAEKQAAKTVKNIKSVFVQSQSAVFDGNEVSKFRVNLKITFEIN